jgi:hypothetical protein
MAISSTGRFSLVKSYSASQANEAWRARRRDMVQGYLNQTASTQSTLASVWSAQIEGSAALAAKAAVARIRTETQAAFKSLDSVKIA